MVCAWSISLTLVTLVTLAKHTTTATPLNVCLVGGSGWSECNAAQPPDTYTGVDVELFRAAASGVGWTEGIHYTFVCRAHGAGWSALAQQLTINGTQDDCAVGSGAFALSSARQALGLQFSYPYYRTGLGVLVLAGSAEIDYFAFMKPFTWQVWVAFLLTIVLVPLLAYLVEQLMTQGAVYLDRDSAVEAWQATYTSVLAVFNLSVYKVRSFAAQCLILVFCFLVMITAATYIANLAAALSNIRTRQRFNDISELQGRRVAAHPTYINILTSSYGLQASAIDFNGLDTFLDIKKALQNGTLDAYVMDYTEIGYYVMAHDDDCIVKLMSHTYALIDLGYLFHKYLDPSRVDTFNQALFRALEKNTVEQLAHRFLLFLSANEKCTTVKLSGAVEFKQLAGLWIILGATVGLAIIGCTASVIRHLTDKTRPEHERKLSNIFKSGASAAFARSSTAGQEEPPVGLPSVRSSSTLGATSMKESQPRKMASVAFQEPITPKSSTSRMSSDVTLPTPEL